MPGRILKLEELSSHSVAALDRQKTAIFLPISPLEGHGRHLPLGVDFFNAIYFADSIARIALQKRPDFDAVISPPFPLGTQLYRQAGSIRISNTALYRVVLGIGESIATWGFRYIFLLSGHGSPKHIVATEAACIRVSRKHKIEMHNLSGALAVRFLTGEFVDRISGYLPRPLTPSERELLKKDFHGGWWETSMMLHLRPELVDDLYRELPSVSRGDKSANPDAGYFGSPAMATREFAEASLKVMTEEGTRIIDRCLAGESIRSETVSPLYKILPLRPYFARNSLAIALIIIILLALALIMKR